MVTKNTALLSLLQLANSGLPVGAYSYSEGLETLISQAQICDRQDLLHWLIQELCYGAIRLDAAVMIRAYNAAKIQDMDAIAHWNTWLTASRETEELRQQGWQMGNALRRLLLALEPTLAPLLEACEDHCNFAIAFGIAAVAWQIDSESSLLGYLHSWLTNLVNAGVKLIPIGQTSGQQLLLQLQPNLLNATQEILTLEDETLSSCSWGLSLASMSHESEYARLFRS